jgi:DNA-binding GntR family transcriptional regulator
MGTANVGVPVAADDGDPSASVRPAASAAGRDRSSRALRPGRPGAEPTRTPRSAVGVLADRLAAALVHHEPGWRLPRHSALARRYNVSAAEIDAAVEELVTRHLVRRLADGQVYRASPAEYVIDLEGISGLATRLDAMGAEFACRSRQLSWRLPPEDISWALRTDASQQVCVVRYLWTADGAPAALLTTYVPADIASRADSGLAASSPSVLNLFQLSGVPGAVSVGTISGDAAVADAAVADAVVADPPVADALVADALVADALVADALVADAVVAEAAVSAASALHLELQAPPPSVARSLRLGAGQPAMIVTIRFDDVATGRPIALTIAVLRPEMFRLVLESPLRPLPDADGGNLSGSWTGAVEGWEP